LGEPAKEVQVIILIHDDYRAKISEVVEQLRAVGLIIEAQGEAIGTITGRIDSSRMHMLEQAKGVDSVEIARSYQLAPPESDVQ
jgi:hypothetical protein